MAIDIIKRTHSTVTYGAQEDGKIIIGESADLSGNLDRIQRMRQAEINSETLGHCIASIPLIELAAWCNKLGLSIEEAAADDAILDRFIADGHQKFMVRNGVH